MPNLRYRHCQCSPLLCAAITNRAPFDPRDMGLRQIHSTQVQSLQSNGLVELLYPARCSAGNWTEHQPWVLLGLHWRSEKTTTPHLTCSGSVWLTTHFTWPIFRFL
jgi:hypothetical protein